MYRAYLYRERDTANHSRTMFSYINRAQRGSVIVREFESISDVIAFMFKDPLALSIGTQRVSRSKRGYRDKHYNLLRLFRITDDGTEVPLTKKECTIFNSKYRSVWNSHKYKHS